MGDSPSIQPLPASVAYPSPKSLSAKAQKNVQPIVSLRAAQTSPVLPPALLLSSAAVVTYSTSLGAYSLTSTRFLVLSAAVVIFWSPSLHPWLSGPGVIYFVCSVFHKVWAQCEDAVDGREETVKYFT